MCKWNLDKLPQDVSRDEEWWSQECMSYRRIPSVPALWSNLPHRHFVQCHCCHCCWSRSQKWLAQDHLQQNSQSLSCEPQRWQESQPVTSWIKGTESLTQNTYVLLDWVQSDNLCKGIKSMYPAECKSWDLGSKGEGFRGPLFEPTHLDEANYFPHILLLFFSSILHMMYIQNGTSLKDILHCLTCTYSPFMTDRNIRPCSKCLLSSKGWGVWQETRNYLFCSGCVWYRHFYLESLHQLLFGYRVCHSWNTSRNKEPCALASLM